MSDHLSAAERRVWARMPAGTAEALDALSATDLQTVLLSVARARAARVRPADLMRRWREDRFVRPAEADPRAVTRVEARLWDLLPAEVEAVELSPVVPLGTCAALTPLSQNRVVTTTRTAEVLSDSTNALAIEAAERRTRRAGPVHLAAVHRQLRAQRFDPGMSAHFRLFALVSSARDTGSGGTEAALLTLHIAYWQRVLGTLVPWAAPRVRVTVFGGVVRERVDDTVRPALAAGSVPVEEEPDRERGRGYYTDAALRLVATEKGREGELGDGGLTAWTARLTGNAKERCLVSCVSTERLTALADTPQ